MLRVRTGVFMKVYWYSINSVTTMVVTINRTPSFSERLEKWPRCVTAISIHLLKASTYLIGMSFHRPARFRVKWVGLLFTEVTCAKTEPHPPHVTSRHMPLYTSHHVTTPATGVAEST